jgi:hypothetical protein
VLRLQPGDVGPDFRIVRVLLEKLPDALAGVAEQGLVDEIDWGSGSLDVQQDGADLAQVDAVRSGM